ncbi:glutamine amidotransferase [Paludibaculum fermentans]|uniref:glutamine amidotransferase n=1 Tax=Paludibaculum fermentans TaxID=1473598 RepID=UPI003EC06D7C
MFEFLFKYPWPVYRKGTLVLLSGWPVWLLGLLALAAAVLVAVLFLRKPLPKARAAVLAGIQWTGLLVLLILLWQPALSVSMLKPQQNVVAVVVDASTSMALEGRIGQAKGLLDTGLLEQLKKRFPVRLYRAGRTLERVETVPAQADQPVTNLGEALKGATAESATLPIGAVVLLSDGADNAGGLDSETMATLRRSRIPIHAIGFGSEQLERDIEVSEVQIVPRSLPDARLSATVTLRQSGFAGKVAKLSVRGDGKVLASRVVKLPEDGQTAREVISFQSGVAGAKSLKVGVDLLEGETNKDNNVLSRLVNVEDRKPRILYIEGEPRWEMKFIRRAAELDRSLQVASILRTTQNKLYRQGTTDGKELEHGFPDTVEELFKYQGLVIGNVEASYFNPVQQGLIKEFVDRRGGGVLFLGGRAALSDGGWNKSEVAEIMPVTLLDRKTTFHRDPATVELAVAGRDSLITRIEEDAEKNISRWKALPYLADYQETGPAKPGALVLAEMAPTSKGKFPLLTTQNFGRGRVGVFATGGSWRWQMLQDSKDMSHEVFWQQLLRWLVSSTSEHVSAVTDKAVYSDETRVPIHVEVRDQNYLPASDAVVEGHVLGPGGVADLVPLRPVTGQPGVYAGEWKADNAGSYLMEVVAKQGEKELGRDVVTFQREDGVAEHFRTEQNRELLERIAQQTGGRYYKPSDTGRLPEEIEYSDAGISVKETRDIWNAPAAFLLFAALKAGEWFLRRRWGAV